MNKNRLLMTMAALVALGLFLFVGIANTALRFGAGSEPLAVLSLLAVVVPLSLLLFLTVRFGTQLYRMLSLSQMGTSAIGLPSIDSLLGILGNLDPESKRQASEMAASLITNMGVTLPEVPADDHG